MSVLDKLKALDEQRSKLLQDAKGEALESAHKAIATLKELGFDYNLIEGARSIPGRIPNSAKTVTQSRRQQRDVSCPVCGFKTNPLHDGRAHRSQEPKKPFTTVELEEKGLQKVT
jgi:hypothetical protein